MVNGTSLGRIILVTCTSSISLKGRPRGEWDFVRENNSTATGTSLGRIILVTCTSSIRKGRPRGECDFVRENNSSYRYIISVWKAVHVVGASLRRIIVATGTSYQSGRPSTW